VSTPADWVAVVVVVVMERTRLTVGKVRASVFFVKPGAAECSVAVR
jgi:hypothetical protein